LIIIIKLQGNERASERLLPVYENVLLILFW